MSEDLFSRTNTGEPKYIVREFVDEVAKTLRWVTAEATRVEEANAALRENDIQAKRKYEESLQKRVRDEKDKVWDIGNLIGNVIHNVVNHQKNHRGGDGSTSTTSPARTRSTVSETSQTGSETIPRDLPSFHKDHLVAFLKRARAAYGRTALCLSGGAMMGLYHFGHLLGLMETDCLPHIISGTSAGSVIGSIICTRTDEELKRDLTPEVLGTKMKCFSRPWGERLKSLWKNGCLFSFDEWMAMIQWFTCGDLTFEEAYHKTGRIFCITLSSPTKKAPPVLLNYISAPNVTIASAVIASAAVPGLIPPVRLQYKDVDGVVRSMKDETYFDGSIEQDIPINGLAEMLNCQFFVACQANPHIVPFFFDARGGVGRPNRWSKGSQEASWRGGFLLAALELYLKNDMKAKFVFLRDLEAAVGFTSTMMTQEYVGSTTIVPQVKISDYFRVSTIKSVYKEFFNNEQNSVSSITVQLFSDPDPNDLEGYFQGGSVAAFQHAAMIRMHYSIADALDECLEKLGAGDVGIKVSRRAKFETNKKISDALARFDTESLRRKSMPAVITAALNDRLEDLSDDDDDDDDENSNMSDYDWREKQAYS
jgi:predicted acylesterase/phospholipase RssA